MFEILSKWYCVDDDTYNVMFYVVYIKFGKVFYIKVKTNFELFDSILESFEYSDILLKMYDEYNLLLTNHIFELIPNEEEKLLVKNCQRKQKINMLLNGF